MLIFVQVKILNKSTQVDALPEYNEYIPMIDKVVDTVCEKQVPPQVLHACKGQYKQTSSLLNKFVGKRLIPW